MTLAVPADRSVAFETELEGFDTDFAAALAAPRLTRLPDHVLPVKDLDEFSRAAKDPHFNAFPLMARDPKVERAIAVLMQSLAEDPRAEVGPLLCSGYYNLEYLPALLDQAVASEAWAQRARPEWEIIKAELLSNTERLCRITGDSAPMAMLAIGSSNGRWPHCDSGGLVYCDFLGSVPTVGYRDEDASLEIARGRQGPVIVPRLRANVDPIRFDEAKALLLRGYGAPNTERDVSYDAGRPFVHNAPDPKDPARPFIESHRLVYVAVS